MVIDSHALLISLHWPGQRNHDFEARQSNTGLELAIGSILGPGCKYREKISLYQVRLVDAAGNVHTIRLLVVESNPSLKVTEHLEGIVSKLIPAIVVGTKTTEL
jgi:hypothetical protein